MSSQSCETRRHQAEAAGKARGVAEVTEAGVTEEGPAGRKKGGAVESWEEGMAWGGDGGGCGSPVGGGEGGAGEGGGGLGDGEGG